MYKTKKIYRFSLYFIVLLYLYNIQCVVSFKIEVEMDNINSSSLSSSDSKNESHLSEDILGHRNRIRHSRYPKLSDLLNKISSLDSLIPINMNLEDSEEDEDMEQEMSTPSQHENTLTTTTTTVEPAEETVKYEKLDDAELDDVEYDEYDDYGEDEEEDLALLKGFLNIDDPRSQALSDIVDRIIDSSDQVNIPEKDFNRNDELSDYFEDWDYKQEYQGSQPIAQEAKWKQHSTRSQFAKPRLHPIISEADKAEVWRHKLMVEEEGACLRPQKKVVSVQSLYPYHSKNYLPRCTILYNCGDDTGCCKLDWYKCTNKTSDRIERKFLTMVIGRRGIYTQVETLAFYNHTECECVPKQPEFILREDETTSTPFHRDVLASDNPAISVRTETEEPMALTKCKCPGRFSPQIKEGVDCTCDCMSKQKDCVRLKRGKEFFGFNDRICILRRDCEKPICEFGSYMLKQGRCPRKQEKF